MHRPGDEFLPSAGLPVDQNGGVGGGYRRNLLENGKERRALANDVAELVFGTHLLLQVGLLLGELVFQRLDLLERQGVLDGDGYLIHDELQEMHVRSVVGRRLLGGDERLLCLPDQPRWVVFRIENDHDRRFDGFGGLQDVQAHRVGRRVVEHHREGIKLHHASKPLGQFVE